MFPRLRNGRDQQRSSGNRKKDKKFGFQGNGVVGMRLLSNHRIYQAAGNVPARWQSISYTALDAAGSDFIQRF